MKIMICIHCQDVKRLTSERAECSCGAAWAHLISFSDKDNHVAANHAALIIGIDDTQLKQTLERKTIDPKGSQRVPAFFLPEPCGSVHRVDDLAPSPPVKRRRAMEARA